jgi:hypothetical protein
MNPLAAFSMLIATAQSLAAAVGVRDELYLRPAFARKAVAARMVTGLRLLRAFLRRLVILIALDLEWGLVDTRGPMKRPHGRKAKPSVYRFTLKGLDAPKPSPWLNGGGPQFAPRPIKAFGPNVLVQMDKLYGELNFLSGIAADPFAKAKRLAFHFARTYEGIMMAPAGPPRIGGRWGTEVSAFFSAMAASIMEKSRNRPPPLPPPRTHWPTIMVV